MDGIIDISIARTPLRLDDVDYKILSSEPMIAVSSKDMLPEKNGSLKLSDLLNIPLIIYRRYEALIMDAFHSRGMEPDLSASATISRRDALGKGRPCHCHFPAVHELSLPGTPHPAARRKRPGNADRRDLERGGNSLRFCRTLSMPAWRAYYNRRSPLRRSLFQGSAQRTSFFISHSFTAQTAARYSAVSQSPQSQTGQFSAADCSRIFP